MKSAVRLVVLAVIAAAFATVAPPAQAGAFYNVAIANLTTRDAYGTVNNKPRDLNAWLTNVDTGASVKLGLNGDGNQWLTSARPDGRYRLSVTSAGKYPTVWWPGVYSAQAAGIIVLREGAGTNCAGQLTTTGCAVVSWTHQVQAARSVSGRVLERWGAGVAGVQVTAVRDADPITPYVATTDGAGFYSMAVPPGTYQFTVPAGNISHTVSADVSAAAASTSVNITRPGPPAAPSQVAVSAASKRLSVTWTASGDNGGRDITGYTATASPGGQSCTTSQTGCVIDGVSNNTTYTVSVVAHNAVGTSAAATSGPVTPLDQVPSVPRDVRATAGSKSAKVFWSQPAVGEGVTGYRVVASPGGQICTTKDLSCTVTGLTNGTEYTFRVIAASTGGESPASDASAPVIPADVPSAPRDVTATAGKLALTVNWNLPADNGGAAITEYTATAMPGGRQCTANASGRSCTIDSLTRRAYTVTVTAANRVGRSVASAPTNEVTPLDDVPPVPTGISATAGDKQAVVSWSAPGNLAEIITGYRVISSPGGFTCTSKDLSCTVSGLTNGVSYTFRVMASSTGGESAASELSAPVTPATVPTPPRAVRAFASDRTVSVRWNAPSDDGGAAINGYTATVWPGGRECSTTEEGRECVIGGLPNGQSVTVTVVARNRVGASERSPGSAQVTPAASTAAQPTSKPAKPVVRLSRGKAGKGKLTVRWVARNAQSVKLTWVQGKGTPRSRMAAASGTMTLTGKRGTRWKVTARTVDPASKPVSRMYRISR